VRYYRQNMRLKVDEDVTHEFKGHMNLSVDEVPQRCVDPGNERPSRQPISKCINGFLNSGKGGIIYLGVDDSRIVKGILLNQYKMDHVEASLRDLMSRYSPPVEPHRISLYFVPVVSQSAENIQSMITFDPSKVADPAMRSMKHVLRTHTYCWCDKELMAENDAGICMPEYIIEIHVHKWNPKDKRNRHGVGQLKTYPIHEDENGNVYMRRDSSVIQCTADDLKGIATNTVMTYYKEIIDRLKKERKELFESTSS